MDEKALEYARLHQAFLQENRPDIYAKLQNTQDVNGYLSSVGQQASEMYDTIMWQKFHSPEVKDLPYMEKVQALEIHRESANEQVLHDIVFQPLPEESPTRRRRSSRARASTATEGKIKPNDRHIGTGRLQSRDHAPTYPGVGGGRAGLRPAGIEGGQAEPQAPAGQMSVQELKTLARKHWEEWLPGKVADLRKQGRLNEDLQGAANLAQAEIEHLMKQGYQEQEAREVALRKFILLPPEPGVDGLDEEQREERAQMEREYQKNPPGLPAQDEEEYARDMMMKSPSDSQPSSPSPAENLKPIREWEEPVLDYALQGLKAAKEKLKPKA